MVFDSDGKFVKSWGSEFACGAHGLHLQKEGSEEFLYLCDIKRSLVVKTTLDGGVVFALGCCRIRARRLTRCAWEAAYPTPAGSAFLVSLSVGSEVCQTATACCEILHDDNLCCDSPTERMKPKQSLPTKPSPGANLGVFSFFSGSGLLDLAFEDSGFETLAMNELSEAFSNAYVYSREKLGRALPRFGCKTCTIDWFLEAEGKKWLAKKVSESRSLGFSVGFIGGPPCPDFSVGGKNRGRHGDNGRLSESYIDVICAQRPDWFLFENVRGLWRTAKHRAFFEHLKEKLAEEGYQLSDKLLNAIQFGAPQDRDRIFLFGALPKSTRKQARKAAPTPFEIDWGKCATYQGRKAFDFPWPKTSPFGGPSEVGNCPQELTVDFWFQKNKVQDHPNAVHYFKPRAGLKKFEAIAEGDDSKKSFKRLHRGRYSPTVCYGNNEVHLHPSLARRISAAEALALQSMPSTFVLPPDMTLSAMFKTIGNGVPYLLGKGVALAVSEFLTNQGGKL